MKKWMCPKCLASGCSTVQPLCDKCDYKVIMHEISDRFYNAYHHEQWKIQEAARNVESKT